MTSRFMKTIGAIPPFRWALAVLSGLMLTAAFPLIGLAWLAWVALVPLLFALRGLPSGGRFLVGFAAGCVHFFLLLYWLLPTLSRYGELPLVVAGFLFCGLVLILALYFGLFALLLNGWLNQPASGVLVVPMIWVALEYGRTILFSGLPWELLGYSQFAHLPLIQVADITGVYGVSFFLAWANAAVFLLLCHFLPQKRRATRSGLRVTAGMIVGFGVLFGCIWIYGNWRLGEVQKRIVQAPAMAMTIVQGNIDQGQKWEPAYRRRTVEKYMTLAEQGRGRSPRLVILPETAMPFYFTHDPVLTGMVREKARATESYFLVGAPSFARFGENFTFYNSAYLITPGGDIVDRYDKVHLVPFGEYLPGGDWLPFLEKIVYGAGDFAPGEKGRLLPLADWQIGVQICYEIIFSEGARQMARKGADVLINITNDAWYGRTSAPHQHFSMTVLRAVETRRSLVRSANTGISGFIEPSGRIADATDVFTAACRTYRVPKLKMVSVYTQVGDLFAKMCVICTVFVVWRGYRRKGQSTAV